MMDDLVRFLVGVLVVIVLIWLVVYLLGALF